MLVFALIQVVFAVGAVYYGGKVAMSFGRDLRKNLFHQVTDFSAREVGTFGAPSLITRITNDVQQVQMLVVMACTMAIAAPTSSTAAISNPDQRPGGPGRKVTATSRQMVRKSVSAVLVSTTPVLTGMIPTTRLTVAAVVPAAVVVPALLAVASFFRAWLAAGRALVERQPKAVRQRGRS
jgi:ATP-binding cassette subfamily B protein